MTVNTSDITSGPYSGNDVASQFAYDFRVENKNQLIVYETDNLGVITTLTVDTDYTVNNIGTDGGGTIDRVAGALPSGYTWYIRSNYQLTQPTAFASQGGFLPEVHEAAMDKLTFIAQQHEDLIGRSFSLPDSYSGGASSELPLPVADTTVVWNGDATALIAGPTATEVANAQSYAIAAQAAQAAAEAVYDNFDDRYLGSKASEPALDNDGNALQDGALFYNTTTNLLNVYDLGTTTWIPLPVTVLASLTDVTLTSLTTNDILRWDGAKWINTTLTADKVVNTPAGNITASDVQAALNELDDEKAGLALANTFTLANTFNEIIASDKGVSFPSTQVPSADVNTLDDYEEGSFTATIYGSTTAGTPTYTNQTFYYRKIGNTVHIQGHLAISALGGMAGNVRISGLPFTARAAPYGGTINIGYSAGLIVTAGVTVTGQIPASTSYVEVNQWSLTSGVATLAVGNISATTQFIFSGEYEVA